MNSQLIRALFCCSFLSSSFASEKAEVTQELYVSVTQDFKVFPSCSRYVVQGARSDVDELVTSLENDPRLTTSRDTCPLKSEEFVTQYFCRAVQEAHVTFHADYFLHVTQIKDLGDDAQEATQNFCTSLEAEFHTDMQAE